MITYTKEQIAQMFAESLRLRQEIRKHHVSTLLQKLNLKGGELLKLMDKSIKFYLTMNFALVMN